MRDIGNFYLEKQKSFKNSKLMSFYDKYFKKTFKYISHIISWTIFVFLVLGAIFLFYYFISVKLYEKKGVGNEPLFGLYTIISPSMEPNLRVYDVTVSKRINSPDDIVIGDVITFNSSDFKQGQNVVVTHRVVEIIKDANNNYLYTTKGDNNFVKDPTPVHYSSIIGKVTTKIPQLGRVQFFVASKLGWLLIVILPALFIIIKEILSLTKQMSSNTKNQKVNSLLNKKLKLSYKKRIDDDSPIKIIGIDLGSRGKNNNEELSKIYTDLKDISK